ncbi:hypothetical protein MTR_4g028330 [Medicago truncatula]|uniref:Transmembrane protein n=1 Tax=Medicago truncatula TaxID=3880 RepID=G7JIC7_MEDTR|nr:hypothetical protein MTR_4g028330 [Medicago truncatula]
MEFGETAPLLSLLLALYLKMSSTNTTTPVAAKTTRKNASGNQYDLGWKHGIDVLGTSTRVK